MGGVAAQWRPGASTPQAARPPSLPRWASVVLLQIILCAGLLQRAEATPAMLDAGPAVLAENLYGVDAFGDGLLVWAVGAFGGVFHSDDGGRTWVTQEAGLQEPLFDVAFASPTHGIVVGKSGVILHTQDGGRSWTRAHSGVTTHLFKIAMVDERRAWVVGDWGVVLQTVDGGRTWIDRSIGADVVLSGVSFADAEHGWSVGEFGTVLFTGDGGRTWRRQASGTEKTLFGVTFTSSQTGWVVGMDGLLLHTMDGGETWTVQRGSAAAGSLEALGFVDFVQNPALYDVAIAGTAGCIVGDTGTVITTHDGGRTWQTVRLPEAVRLFWLRAASVTPGSRGILVGAKGLVVSLVDGDVVTAGAGERDGVGPVR